MWRSPVKTLHFTGSNYAISATSVAQHELKPAEGLPSPGAISHFPPCCRAPLCCLAIPSRSLTRGTPIPGASSVSEALSSFLAWGCTCSDCYRESLVGSLGPRALPACHPLGGRVGPQPRGGQGPLLSRNHLQVLGSGFALTTGTPCHFLGLKASSVGLCGQAYCVLRMRGPQPCFRNYYH